MKSILERIRKYVGSAAKRGRDRAQPEPADPSSERTADSRTSFEDPYAEMRRVLATAMLLG
jgi:hypothetical protein